MHTNTQIQKKSVVLLVPSRHKPPERRDRGLSGVTKQGLIIEAGLNLPASDSRVGHKRLTESASVQRRVVPHFTNNRQTPARGVIQADLVNGG